MEEIIYLFALASHRNQTVTRGDNASSQDTEDSNGTVMAVSSKACILQIRFMPELRSHVDLSMTAFVPFLILRKANGLHGLCMHLHSIRSTRATT